MERFYFSGKVLHGLADNLEIFPFSVTHLPGRGKHMIVLGKGGDGERSGSGRKKGVGLEERKKKIRGWH